MSEKPQHGDRDQEQQKWYCNYWMSQEEWLGVHDYTPIIHGNEGDGDVDRS